MKANKSTPPPVIDSARVIVHATVDKSVVYTGNLHLLVGGKRLGKVPKLAICKNMAGGRKDFLILFCNDKWQSRGVVSTATLKEAKQAAESYYAGISKRFVKMDVSERAARRWLEEKYPDLMCSFCGRLYFEFESAVSSKKATVCGDCIRAFAQQLESIETDAGRRRTGK